MAFYEFEPPSFWFAESDNEMLDAMTPQEFDECVENFTWNEERKMAWVMKWRQGMLIWSDWTVLPDSPLSDEDKQLWMNYRQALRDIPEQNLPADEIVVPKPPWGITPKYG